MVALILYALGIVMLHDILSADNGPNVPRWAVITFSIFWPLFMLGYIPWTFLSRKP